MLSGFLCIGAAGYIMLIASENAVLSYVAVYLATCGIYPLIPNTMYVVQCLHCAALT